ncbi:MAG TPA: hypothetical protein VKZ53_22095 [Candidatus Angelobacter sp.]|nr:hypothetical protein [Candidatus Angelobacter sp.]
MTLSEIAEILPNGFHDAEVEEFQWSYSTNSAVFKMTMWTATELDEDPEKYRRASIELNRILLIAIDPPMLTKDRLLDGARSGTLQIDGVPANEEIFPGLRHLKANLPADADVYSFYVNNWNSYIHVAAQQAKLTWLDEQK